MISYTDHPKDTTRKLLEVIKEFSIVSGSKFNIQKSVAFLSPNKKLLERKVKKTIPFTVS